MGIIDHITVNVRDLARSRSFYEAALAPLGIRPLMDFGEVACGFGIKKPELWIGCGAASFQKPEQLDPITPLHVAIVAHTRAEVDAFHAAAMAAGATDNGAPGPRPHYHANYYGAFVLDPDGNNIEAVVHRAE
jgi:catechol 2,3-dioxygenase-like lactoylglutathione lyase family enzyme